MADAQRFGPAMPSVTWSFDFISPYAYVQAHRLEPFAAQASLTLRPVLFAGLLNHWGTVGPAETPPKRLWTYRFCHWLARQHGLPFKTPPRHPFNPLKPLRLAIAAGAAPEAVKRIYDFIWGQGRDVDDAAEWAALMREFPALDAADLEAPAVKQALRANTDAAIAEGVFGVPSFTIGRDVFWGVDATDFALAALGDPTVVADPEYRRAADIEIGIERKR
jgi:2-hydroxychromene-2-carboxylate isomerase